MNPTCVGIVLHTVPEDGGGAPGVPARHHVDYNEYEFRCGCPGRPG